MRTYGRTDRRLWRALAVAVLLALPISGCTDDEPDQPAAGNPAGTGMSVVRVPEDADTITAALDLVAAGGMVLVGPGTYAEEVTIDTPDVTLRGVDRNATVIDGGGTRPFGVFASADGVRIENLTVHSTTFYGVLVTGMHDENGPLAHGGPGYSELDPAEFPPVERFSIDHVTAYNNGLYGIYAFNARHGTITNSYASGSADSGFYVGQCEECDILVASNVAERNAIGFENANASNSLMIAGNRFTGNRIGMTLISNYQEAFTPQRDNVVAGNLLGPNASADSPAHALGGFGVGLSINGGQGNEVTANRIDGNPVAGIMLTNAEDIAARENRFAGNSVAGNGLDVADVSAARTPATANCFQDNTATTWAPASLVEALCPPSQEAAGVPAGPADLPVVAVPNGMSFLEVPGPPGQPGLADVQAMPEPLPPAVEMPPTADFPLPGATLLADRASAP